MKAAITVPYLSRAMSLRGMSRSELAARSGVSRETIGFAARGRPIGAASYRKIVSALDLVPISPIAHELGVRVVEAPAGSGGDSS